MKYIFRLAGLLLLFSVLIGCSSPPPEQVETDGAEEVAAEVEEVATRVLEAEEDQEVEEVAEPSTSQEEVAEQVDSAEAEEEINEPVVDGPSYEPATSVEQAIQERSNDQAKGADEPLLTVIEYGDFQ